MVRPWAALFACTWSCGSSIGADRSDAGGDPACVGLSCAPGTKCAGGICVPADPCRGVVCSNPGNVCSAGACVSGDADEDGDGVVARDDCDDSDPAAHPEAIERCDGKDDDCDGAVDEWQDGDGDGVLPACGRTVPFDCDDGDPAVRPGASDSCNGRDDDCDGWDGALAVPGGLACCAGREVDLGTSPDHCGACGAACPDDEQCRDGECLCGIARCPEREACCGGD